MKKSNKLLLGGFLTVLLMIAGIHIALFAKYKNGNYTIYYQEDRNADDEIQSFPGISSVVIRNVGRVSVRFGDKAGVEKEKDADIKFIQNGDSLVIIGHYFAEHPDRGSMLNVTLPYSATLSAVNSFLYFSKGEKDAGTNTVVYLQQSHAVFFKSGTPSQLGHVKVVASDNSLASFLGNTQVNQLEAQLSNSALEYNQGDVGELSIVTDSISRLSLQSKLLFKAKITTVPNNP